MKYTREQLRHLVKESLNESTSMRQDHWNNVENTLRLILEELIEMNKTLSLRAPKR